MRQAPSIPILGMACAAHTGERLSGSPSPANVKLEALNLSVPYYSLQDAGKPMGTQWDILDGVIDRALASSGLDSQRVAGMGLFVGSSSYDLRTSELLLQQQLAARISDPIPVNQAGNCQISDWIGDRFHIAGEAFNINTACTSSANALLLAQRMLHLGLIEHALVIGIELFNETTLHGFASLQLLASEQLAPFDKNRDGLLLGEGCAAVVLGREQSGDEPFRLAGGGANFDPHSITAAAEDGRSIAACLRSALYSAGVDACEIRGIKAQGSGSHTNDLAESRGLHWVFGPELPPVTAIKPYIGHTLGACGVLELVLFCQQLAQGVMPPTLNFSTPDPELSIAPITAEQPADPGSYLLNFFGFGGNNTVLALEKAQ